MSDRPETLARSAMVTALSSPRTAALGAALALHALFFAVTQRAWGEARAPLAVRAMTVRSIAASVAEPVALVGPAPPVTMSSTRAERAVASSDASSPSPSPPTLRETRALAVTAASTPSGSTTLLATLKAPIPETHSLLTAPPETQDAVASLPAAPDYLMGTRLDPGPQPIGEIEPEYPDSGHLREGTVVLRILIGESGHVDNVAVVRSTPTGAFEDAAIEAFAKASFSPGRVAGVPVKSQITVEVHFIPINRGARISGRSY